LNDRWYSDSNCTARLAVFRAYEEILGQFTYISMEMTDGAFQVFQTAGRVVQYIYTKPYGTCTYVGTPPADFDYHLLTEVDMSEYQGQVETIE
jgi:predicted nucleic acid-binding Zn finger protein